MKKSLILLGMLSIGYAYAQQGNVGINTTNPQATLDIKPNAENTKAEAKTNQGIIAPRLSKVRVANIETPIEGTLVYVTDETSSPISAYTGTDTKVSKITERGYYYYNGTEWVKSGNNTEWVYDATTKRINLKRSGNTHIFYDEIGGFKNIDFGIHSNHSLIDYAFSHNEEGTFNYFEPYSALIKQASSIGSNNPKILTRYMNYSSLVLDAAAKKTDYVGMGMSIAPKNEAIDMSNVTSYIASLAINNENKNSVKVNQLRGIINNVYVTNENTTVDREVVGYRSDVSMKSNIKIPTIKGSHIDVLAKKNTSSDMVRGDLKYVTFDESVGTFENVIVDEAQTTIWKNSSPTITNLYQYKGGAYVDKNSSSANVKNFYGLYLGDINIAQNNYAIYTNAGKVRFGDNVEVAGAIKVSNTTSTCTTANRGTIKFENDNFYGCKSTGWVQLNN